MPQVLGTDRPSEQQPLRGISDLRHEATCYARRRPVALVRDLGPGGR
ncbi:Uncharacterised protein [Mycobacteroides abscessus]|nr:Uncharacterised protein [Mycobacteroides abscessus]